MKYTNIILGGLVAFAGAAVAMPTQEETKKVEPLVLDLMKNDQVALKSGKKTRVEVAESAMALADKADSEAAKLLLMKGAFNLYVRAGEFDKAIETLQSLQAAIPDMPPANVANIIEASLRVVSRKNGGQLYRLLDETKTRMRYTSAAKKMEKALKESPNDRQLRTKLAEHYAYLGKWDKALENFIAADGKAGAIAKAEQGGEAGEKAADFWWSYPTGKADELVKSFRTHAAKLYEDAIADGKITGLNKVQAERRIEETKEYGELTAFMTPDVKTFGSSLNFDVGHNIMLEMMKCPAGKFTLGYEGEKRTVKISRNFWMSKYPITLGQYFEITQGGNSDGYSVLQTALGGNMAAAPMRSYKETMEFCDVLNQKFKNKLPASYVFRLPTYAEFEYAQKAGSKNGSWQTRLTIPHKDASEYVVFMSDLKQLWVKNNLEKEMRLHTDGKLHCWQFGYAPVGTKKPNIWGLYDLFGMGEMWMMLDTINVGDPFVSGVPQKGRGFLHSIKISWNQMGDVDPFLYTANEEKFYLVRAGIGNEEKDEVRNGMGWLAPTAAHGVPGHFRLVVGPDLVSEWKAKQKK